MGTVTITPSVNQVKYNGVEGPIFVKCLQRHLGVAEDGYAGMETVKALQAQLGQGRI